jgi:hypothetical protein
MNLNEMDGKEKAALIGGLLLVGIVFATSAYTYFNPPVQVWEGKVFEVWESDNGDTNILSYGEGKIKIPGSHDIEVDATYRITYQSRARNTASIIISIEKIDG